MKDPKKVAAFQLIILFGLVSLFGDIVYEGARSVNGPYLLTLGTSAALVGLIAGLGEFLGYGIRILSGFFADRTRAYWVFTLIGYGLLVSVPLLALAGTWQWAALFIVLERLGKAIRSPAKDVILSQAAKRVGTGFGFGLHEAMDQIGAVTGPLIFAFALSLGGEGVRDLAQYQGAYSLLWIPFILVILSVFVAFIRVPDPEALEPESPPEPSPEARKTLKLYLAFTFFTTLGFIAFPLLAFYWKATSQLLDFQIPLVYALAMGVDALAALVLGKVYDKLGLRILWIFPILSIPLTFLGFGAGGPGVWILAILWGVVMGAHETLMKAAVSDLVPIKKRGTAFGLFHTAYGLAFMAGAAMGGVLLEIHWIWIALFCTLAQIVAVVFLWLFLRRATKLKVTT